MFLRRALLAMFMLCIAVADASPVGNAEFTHALHAGMSRSQVVRIARWDGGCVGNSKRCLTCEGFSYCSWLPRARPTPLLVTFLYTQSNICGEGDYVTYVLRFGSTGRLQSWRAMKFGMLGIPVRYPNGIIVCG